MKKGMLKMQQNSNITENEIQNFDQLRDEKDQ